MNSPVHSNRARYNRMAWLYEAMVRFGSFGQFARFYRAVANAIEPDPGASLLDIGCGPGTLTPYLLPKIAPEGTLLGTDISDNMIARARSRAERENWQNARFERADAREFAPPAPLDIAVFCLSLSTIPEPERCFSKALSWLHPGGQVVVLDSFLEADRRAAGLAIRLKSPAVGADPRAVSLSYLKGQLESPHVQRFHAGVYTLVSGRKPEEVAAQHLSGPRLSRGDDVP